MRKRIRTLLWLALLLVSLFTLLFATRVYQHSQRLRERRDEPIEAWMNIPFISHSYHVPPEIIQDAIGLPREQRDRRPLSAIAEEQGRPPEELILAITQAISDTRALEPPPPPRPPPPPTPFHQEAPGP